jgi:hypothetical protein
MSTSTVLHNISISESDISTVLQSNLVSLLDYAFLDSGGFTTVTFNQTDIRGNNQSRLRAVEHPSYKPNHVWATASKNLVWESGLSTLIQPTQISGVYVNGNLVQSGYVIDYPNGLVIFPSGVNATTVNMEYSYKNINVIADELIPALERINNNNEAISSGTFFSAFSGEWSTVPERNAQLPTIAVEVSPRISFKPLELGNRSHILNTEILCHVIDRDKTRCRKVAYNLVKQQDSTFWLYDIDRIVASGDTPLTINGSLSQNPLTYPQLVEKYKYNKFRLMECILEGPNQSNF